MTEVEFRKMQEAIANIARMKLEIASIARQMYVEFKNQGFNELQALELTKAAFFPRSQI